MPSTSTSSPRSPVQPSVNKSPLPAIPRDLNEAILGHPGLRPVNRASLSNEMVEYLGQRRIAVAGETLSDNIPYSSLASDNDEA